MQIDLVFDSSVTNNANASQIEAALTYVANLYDQMFTNSITITINVGWGEVGGSNVGSGDLGESSWSYYQDFVSYGNLKADFVNNATNPFQSAVYANMPSSDPTGGQMINVPVVEAAALGLVNPDQNGSVGFGSSYNWYFGTGTAPSNEYDLVAVAEHEISEVMGRTSFLSGTVSSDILAPMDLFRFAAPGERDLTVNSPTGSAYFSIDNGVTDLDNWNPTSGNGDLGDWAPSAGPDAYDDFSGTGANYLTTTDIELMNILGYNMSYNPATTVVNGVTALSQTIISGGAETVMSGGEWLGGGVGSNATLVIDHGGFASGLTVSAGATVVASGLVSSTILDFGTLEQFAGGSLVGATGTGTIEYGSGLVLSNATFNAGNVVYEIGSGAVMDGGQVTSVSTLQVASGATASGVTVNGALVDSGVVSNVILANGAKLYQYGNGKLVGESGNGTVVFAGGSVISGETMNASGIVFSAAGGANVQGGSLTSVSTLVVGAGAVVSGINLAGEMIVYGTASNTVLNYGTLVEMGGGVLVGATGTGAIEYGGGLTLNGAVFNAGNVVYEIGPGGVMDAGSVTSVSTLVVEAGASASGVSVAGELVVSGFASNTILAGGTLEQIGGGQLAGASGSGTIIYGSGVNLSGASMNGPAIVLEVGSGANFQSADITSVSTVVALSGAVASAIKVEGELILNAGASIAGGLVLNGGEALIAGSVAAGQTISFTASGGDLVLDNLAAFSANISGMATSKEKIDLGGFTFGAGETVSWVEAGGGTSGTLTVVDGAKTATLTLLGSYVTSDFSLSNDGIGGTFVVDPPGASASTAAATSTAVAGVANFTQAMAAFGQTSAMAQMDWQTQTSDVAHGQITSALILGPSTSGMA